MVSSGCYYSVFWGKSLLVLPLDFLVSVLGGSYPSWRLDPVLGLSLVPLGVSTVFRASALLLSGLSIFFNEGVVFFDDGFVFGWVGWEDIVVL